MSHPRTIVVRSATRVYGPFATAESALDWVEIARRAFSIGERPFCVEAMDDPAEAIPNFGKPFNPSPSAIDLVRRTREDVDKWSDG